MAAMVLPFRGFPWVPMGSHDPFPTVQAKTQRKITERRAAKGLAGSAAEVTVQQRVAGWQRNVRNTLGWLGKAWETEGKPMENGGKPWKTHRKP